MSNKQLLDKITALEKRIEELERRPVYVPYYVPAQPPHGIEPWQPYVGPTCPGYPSTQPIWISQPGAICRSA